MEFTFEKDVSACQSLKRKETSSFCTTLWGIAFLKEKEMYRIHSWLVTEKIQKKPYTSLFGIAFLKETQMCRIHSCLVTERIQKKPHTSLFGILFTVKIN